MQRHGKTCRKLKTNPKMTDIVTFVNSAIQTISIILSFAQFIIENAGNVKYMNMKFTP